MFNKHIARRLWNNDRSVLEGLWQEYFHNREQNLVRYASALYSFREDALLRKKLLGMRTLLIDFCLKIDSAEECDVVSTILEWMHRQPETTGLSLDLADYALRVCNRGIRLSLSPENDHTKPLLLLTKARLVDDWKTYVEQAEVVVEKIEDANQQARVFRKIGMLYRMNAGFVDWLWWRGLWWGIRAIFVPGSTMGVRVKSLGALFVDR